MSVHDRWIDTHVLETLFPIVEVDVRDVPPEVDVLWTPQSFDKPLKHRERHSDPPSSGLEGRKFVELCLRRIHLSDMVSTRVFDVQRFRRARLKPRTTGP